MTIWLHVGVPKAGSTTLQHFLETNRAALAERDIVVPKGLSTFNHRKLKLFADDDDVIDNPRRAKGMLTPQKVRKFRARFEGQFRAEAAQWEPRSNVVMTCEHLVGITSDSGRERLRGLLDATGHQTRIVVYVRRQDRVLLSGYVQSVRGGNTGYFDDYLGTMFDSYYRYDRVLDDWSRSFGEAQMVVRPFERSQLCGGSIVDDFMSLLGISDLSGFETIPDLTVSLPGPAVEYLRRLNPHIPRWLVTGPNEERKLLLRILDRTATGERAALSEERARAIVQEFAAGNAEVARRWLGRSDGVLFREGYEPGETRLPAIDADEFAALTAHVVIGMAALVTGGHRAPQLPPGPLPPRPAAAAAAGFDDDQ